MSTPYVPPSIDLVVTNYRTAADLRLFFAALGFSHSVQSISIMNVDPRPDDVNVANACVRELYAMGYTDVRHTIMHGVGYGRVSNIGGSAGQAEVIAIFNADVEIAAWQLELCAEHLMSDSLFGVLGPRQIDQHGFLRHCGATKAEGLYSYRAFGHADRGQFLTMEMVRRISGSAMFVKREVWNELNCSFMPPGKMGPLLESPLFFEDTWLCVHAMRHTWVVVYDGSVTIIHKWRRAINAALDRGDFSQGDLFDRLEEARLMFETYCAMHGIKL